MGDRGKMKNILFRKRELELLQGAVLCIVGGNVMTPEEKDELKSVYEKRIGRMEV